MSEHKLQGVVFDMGDILYDATQWRRWLTDRLIESGVTIDYPRLVHAWEEALVPVYLGNLEYWSAFDSFLEGYDISSQEITQISAEAATKGKEFSREHMPFKEVPAGLKKLVQAGLKLAVLSDTESSKEKVTQKLARFKIAEYFTSVVTSADIGFVKPMPEAFDYVLNELGLTKNATAFVAHDLDELAGSTAYGLTTIAFNFTEEVPADVHASTFDGVVDAILSRC